MDEANSSDPGESSLPGELIGTSNMAEATVSSSPVEATSSLEDVTRGKGSNFGDATRTSSLGRISRGSSFEEVAGVSSLDGGGVASDTSLGASTSEEPFRAILRHDSRLTQSPTVTDLSPDEADIGDGLHAPDDTEVEGFSRRGLEAVKSGEGTSAASVAHTTPAAVVGATPPSVAARQREDNDLTRSRRHRPTPPPFPIINGSGGEKAAADAKSGNVGTKSWASLFAGSIPSSERIQVEKPMARIPPFSATGAELSSLALASVSQTITTPMTRSLGDHLKSYNLQHVAPSFLPRGLTNRF